MMSNTLKSKLTGIAILFFAFILPAFITFTTYATVDNVNSDTTEITMNFIGIIIITSLFFGLIKWQKKRVRNKVDSGLKVSPYWILFLNNTFGLVLLVMFSWFIYTIKDDIVVFSNILIIIIVCELIAYGLKYLQTHFDILIKKESE